MARITVEDCLEVVSSRFELVHLAARRSRELGTGSEPRLPRDNDKNTIIALREIAEGAVSPDELRDAIINDFRHIEDEDILPELGDELIDIGRPPERVRWEGDDRLGGARWARESEADSGDEADDAGQTETDEEGGISTSAFDDVEDDSDV